MVTISSNDVTFSRGFPISLPRCCSSLSIFSHCVNVTGFKPVVYAHVKVTIRATIPFMLGNSFSFAFPLNLALGTIPALQYSLMEHHQGMADEHTFIKIF